MITNIILSLGSLRSLLDFESSSAAHPWLGLLLAAVTVSGAFARAEQSVAPARALQGAGAVLGKPDQTATGFETGKTTLHEVEHAIGEPNTSTIDAGKRTACYQYAGTPTVPESFIRIFGSGCGGADLSCCYRFTESGVLDGVDSNVTQINSALISAATADTKAGRKITCPPPMLEVKPDAVMQFDFSESR